MITYDLITIGTGAASRVAQNAADAGLSVAIVDSRPYGGTCSQRGCDPKKTLLDAVRAMHAVKRLQGKGLAYDDLRIDWSDLIRFKRTFTEEIPERTRQYYREKGIAMYHGRARFVDRDVIDVDGERICGRTFVIGTGSAPAPLGIEGEGLLTTSDEFLDLDRLPERIICVGGGYISFELAHLAGLAGSSVVILNDGKRPLENFDPDLVEKLSDASLSYGIDLSMESSVTAVHRHGNRLRVDVEGGASFIGDCVLHGAGRPPQVKDLDLDTAGVAWSEKGIEVHSTLRSTTNDKVWAIGDCVAGRGAPLTPVASRHGSIVSHNLLKPSEAPRTFDETAISSVVFSVPPVARVGALESELREEGRAFDVAWSDCAEWFTVRHLNEPCAGYKIMTDPKSGKVLGAHLTGPYADEQINLFAMAMRHGLTVDQIRDVFYAYPTGGSDLPGMLG